jgi:hypothetical protein
MVPQGTHLAVIRVMHCTYLLTVPPTKHPGSPTPVIVARAEEEAPVKRIGGKRSPPAAEFSDRPMELRSICRDHSVNIPHLPEGPAAYLRV